MGCKTVTSPRRRRQQLPGTTGNHARRATVLALAFVAEIRAIVDSVAPLRSLDAAIAVVFVRTIATHELVRRAGFCGAAHLVRTVSAFCHPVAKFVVVDAIAAVSEGDSRLADCLAVRTRVCTVTFIAPVATLNESVAARTLIHAPGMPRTVGAPEHVCRTYAGVATTFITPVRAVLFAIANELLQDKIPQGLLAVGLIIGFKSVKSHYSYNRHIR